MNSVNNSSPDTPLPYPARPENLTTAQNKHLDVLDLIYQRYSQSAAYREIYPDCSPRAAYVKASELMKMDHVREYREQLQRWAESTAGIESWRIISELQAIAYGRPDAVMEWDDDGVKLIPSTELTNDELAQISSVSSTTKITENGGEVVTQKVSFHSKIQALKLLADMSGMTGDYSNAIRILHSYGVVLKMDESGRITGVEDLRAEAVDSPKPEAV